jgi:pyruvate-formate lyase
MKERSHEETGMKSRINSLRDTFHVETCPLSTEKVFLITESFKSTNGEPRITRRARVLANVLDKITISIKDNELIFDIVAAKPMRIEFDYDYGNWSQDEIDNPKRAGYAISTEEAHAKPEHHGNLVVRVTDYRAYFIQSGQAMQGEIIGPTEHTRIT